MEIDQRDITIQINIAINIKYIHSIFDLSHHLNIFINIICI